MVSFLWIVPFSIRTLTLMQIVLGVPTIVALKVGLYFFLSGLDSMELAKAKYSF